MFAITIPAILQWIGLFEQVQSRGGAAWASIKAALDAHGIEADTAQLDAVIADAEVRKARAERDAAGDPASE